MGKQDKRKNNKKLNEKKVLKKLKINNFTEVSKKNIDKFIELFNNMDPEVAKKALDQIPHFFSCVESSVQSSKEVINKMMGSNDLVVKSNIEVCLKIIASIEKSLEDKNNTEEQKRYLIEKMLEVQSRMDKIDTRNKNFIIAMIVGVGSVLAIIFNRGRDSKA